MLHVIGTPSVTMLLTGWINPFCRHVTLIGRCCLQVVHIFSHIHQTYVVHRMRLKDGDIQAQSENAQWLSRSALQEAAVSTGVKKVCVVFPELVCVESLLCD